MKKILYLYIILTLTSGCINTYEKINYDEIVSNKSKASTANKLEETLYVTTHLQPKNKNEPCLITLNSDNNIIQNIDIYWDGQCKNGYADGLGRSFIKKNKNLILEEITDYSDNTKTEIRYYAKSYDYNFTFEGIKNLGILTRIYDSPSNIEIEFSAGDVFQEKNKKNYTTHFYPIKDIIQAKQTVNNEGYQFIVYNNPYDFLKYKIGDISNSKGSHGFGIEVSKDGQIGHFEYQNNTPVRQVILPDEFIAQLKTIEKEVSIRTNQALRAQSEAKNIINKYKDNICKSKNVIDEISNKHYFDICDSTIAREQLKKIIADEKEKYLAKSKAEYTVYIDRLNLKMQQAMLEAQQNQVRIQQSKMNIINSQATTINNNLQQLNNELLFRRLGLFN